MVYSVLPCKKRKGKGNGTEFPFEESELGRDGEEGRTVTVGIDEALKDEAEGAGLIIGRKAFQEPME